MKILMINKFHYPRGGSETYYFGLSRLLADNGHKVIYFSAKDERNAPSGQGKFFAEKVNLDKFSLKNILKIFYNYEAVKKLKSLLAEERPDIAHLHNIDYQLSGAIIKTIKKEGIPIVQTLHDYKIICPNYKLFSRGKICRQCLGGKYYHCFFNKCVHNLWLKSFLAAIEAYFNDFAFKRRQDIDFFIAPSEFMKEMCVQAGINAEKIRVLRNFIDEAEYIVREPAENYILYFGRLSEEKGILTAVRAMKNVDDGIELLIAGEGPEEEKIREEIKNLRLEERVGLLGYVSGEPLKKLVASAAAVVVPSVWPENMPYSLAEALAAGKIVIASDVGGIKELIMDGKNGFLFAPGQDEELAEKINGVFKKNRVVPVGRLKTFDGLDPGSHYKKIVEIYNNYGSFNNLAS